MGGIVDVSGEVVAVHPVVGLGMAAHGLDGGSAPHGALDGRHLRDAPSQARMKVLNAQYRLA